MSFLKFKSRKPVSSLVSLSTECVAGSISIYSDSLQYLPPHIKERILVKLLRSNKILSSLDSSKILGALVHQNLKCINLSSITVDDDVLNVLRECRALTDISLRNYGAQSISSTSLKHLFEQTSKLLVLDISFCDQFDDEVLECLSINCPCLCELACENCGVTDRGIIALAKNNKGMKCLTISNSKITGNGISEAVKNKNWRFLQELRLDNCTNVDDSVLKTVIQNCPKLEILTFYNCAITDETTIFQDITDTCKKLKQLHWTISW